MEHKKCCGTTCDKQRVAAEFEKLKRERDEAVAELNDLKLQSVIDATKITDIAINDGVKISLEGGACQILAEAFGEQLYKSSAENYIELSFASKLYPDLGNIVVTAKRGLGLTPHQMRMKAERERDEALAQNERVSAAANRLSFSIVFDGVELRPAAEKQFSELQNVLAEQPPAALEALKAEWQADLTWIPAENFSDLEDGEFCVVWVESPLFSGWKTACFRRRPSEIDFDGIDEIFVFDEFSYNDHNEVTHYFVPGNPTRTGGQ